MKNTSFENLTHEEKLVLSMKGSLKKFKEIEEPTKKAFYGALIGKIAEEMKELGIYNKYFG